jgi:23S rRNA pseudouridine2605 synthase
MRLNAFLAKSGIASRRGSDELIKAGKVRVNGRLGRLNDEVSEMDKIEVNNQQVKLRKSRYILLYKPAGYLTTLKDPHGRRKVTDLIKINDRVVPVGRLDYDTSGVLLMTNDGQLAHRLMHPSFEVEKVYEAEVKGRITPEILNMLSIGVELDGGKTAPAKAGKLADDKVELIIHEGRKHQVRRMLAAVGLETVRLHRRQYGPLTLDGLPPGHWRDLTEKEVQKLM